jgi:ferritin
MSVSHDLALAISTIEKLKKQKTELNNRVSTLDKAVNDYYHVIELLPLNASELSTITKKLKCILKERRQVKEQVIAVSNFLSSQVEGVKDASTIAGNIKQREEKYRAEALLVYESIFGKKKILK